MSSKAQLATSQQFGALHAVGVACGLGAGVWLGAAEAPTKLVNSGLSPFAISLCMVAGVFMHLISEKKVIYAVLILTAAFFLLVLLLPSFTIFESVAV